MKMKRVLRIAVLLATVMMIFSTIFSQSSYVAVVTDTFKYITKPTTYTAIYHYDDGAEKDVFNGRETGNLITLRDVPTHTVMGCIGWTTKEDYAGSFEEMSCFYRAGQVFSADKAVTHFYPVWGGKNETAAGTYQGINVSKTGQTLSLSTQCYTEKQCERQIFEIPCNFVEGNYYRLQYKYSYKIEGQIIPTTGTTQSTDFLNSIDSLSAKNDTNNWHRFGMGVKAADEFNAGLRLSQNDKGIYSSMFTFTTTREDTTEEADQIFQATDTKMYFYIEYCDVEDYNLVSLDLTDIKIFEVEKVSATFKGNNFWKENPNATSNGTLRGTTGTSPYPTNLKVTDVDFGYITTDAGGNDYTKIDNQTALRFRVQGQKEKTYATNTQPVDLTTLPFTRTAGTGTAAKIDWGCSYSNGAGNPISFSKGFQTYGAADGATAITFDLAAHSQYADGTWALSVYCAIIQPENGANDNSSMRFKVEIDGVNKKTSSLLVYDSAPEYIRVDIPSGAKELTLIGDPALNEGPGNHFSDWGFWAEPLLIKKDDEGTRERATVFMLSFENVTYNGVTDDLIFAADASFQTPSVNTQKYSSDSWLYGRTDENNNDRIWIASGSHSANGLSWEKTSGNDCEDFFTIFGKNNFSTFMPNIVQLSERPKLDDTAYNSGTKNYVPRYMPIVLTGGGDTSNTTGNTVYNRWFAIKGMDGLQVDVCFKNMGLFSVGAQMSFGDIEFTR